MVFMADKPVDAILLWEKNTVPWLISRTDKLKWTGRWLLEMADGWIAGFTNYWFIEMEEGFTNYWFIEMGD
jgi:hypothetical protein